MRRSRREVLISAAAIALLLGGFALMHLFRPSVIGISTAFHYALHAPFFAILTLILGWILERRLMPVRAWVWAGLLALTVGLVGETLQGIAAGDPSWGDVGLDLIGIGGALSSVAVWRLSIWSTRLDWRRWAAATVATALILAIVSPPLWVCYVLLERNSSVPALLTFEYVWESSLYGVSDGSSVMLAPAGWPPEPHHVVEVVTGLQGSATINIHDPYPDWRKFESFSFIGSSRTKETVPVNLRIHDRSHTHEFADRFNRTLEIGPVPQRFTILLEDVANAPHNRKMDLSEIDGVILFTNKNESQVRIVVGDFRLN